MSRSLPPQTPPPPLPPFFPYQFKFSPAEVLRKYLRYVLNEQPFSPSTVAALLTVRQASALSDEEVVEVVNEIGRRVVKQKGEGEGEGRRGRWGKWQLVYIRR